MAMYGQRRKTRVKSLIKTANAGTAAQLTSTDTWVSSVEFYGYKAVSNSAVPTSNVGDVHLAFNSASSPNYKFGMKIALGKSRSFILNDGEALNLADVYILTANNNDGVFVEYIEMPKN